MLHYTRMPVYIGHRISLCTNPYTKVIKSSTLLHFVIFKTFTILSTAYPIYPKLFPLIYPLHTLYYLLSYYYLFVLS
ncbi:hypothetical protein BGW37DRAFT_492057 [Umbelopsis sp. PMI_123]|nr:hypothetical protein BGW37DRAFT_492057 [Umbelopsis sp. PMI_123]